MKTSQINLKSKSLKPFRLEQLELVVENLPEVFDGYRIAQLSDLHLGACTQLSHIVRSFEIVKEEKPNLIFLTGDYLQYGSVGLQHMLATKVDPKVFRWTTYRRYVRKLAKDLHQPLSELTAEDGVIGVFGNHDYLEGIGTLRRQLPKHIEWLVNESKAIVRGSHSLVIGGLDDTRFGSPDLRQTTDSALAFENACCRILLSHNPDVTTFKENKLLDHFALVLSGHTHGGQICLPGGIPLITRTEQRKHISGLSRHGETHIYVNRGVGCGGLPIRLFCPPEVTMITLRRRQPES